MGTDAGRFSAHDTKAAVRIIDGILRDEGSWGNLFFEPLDDEVSDESPLFGFLAARGPANPLATIMAPTTGKRQRSTEVGIQHRAGTKAAVQLREESVFAPEGSRVVQDHPRRGLVVRWPENEQTATLVAWLFPAMRILGRAATTDDVLYEITTSVESES